jgi:chromosome transmission fidelity protein 4
MNDLLDMLDEKSNDSTESVVKPKKVTSKAKNDLKSPVKKRKRLSDNDDEEAEDSETRDEDEGDLIELLDAQADAVEDDDESSLEKIKSKVYSSVKKNVAAMDLDEEENDGHALNSADLMPKKEVVFRAAPVLKQVQASFQPSATLLSLPERYMAWNSVGLITQFNKEGDESIDIEFHNVSLHHTIHIKNQYGYTMGALSTEAVILASSGQPKFDNDENSDAPPDHDEFISATDTNTSTHSKLMCILLNSNDMTKEWSIDMLKREFIRCVAVSKLMIVCGTSRRFLRIYCLAGTQKEIICMSGTPVCVAVYDNRIFVAHSNSGTNLDYSIFFIDDDSRETEHGQIALTDNNAKLEWLGFSDEGNPYYYDSNGYLFTKCLTVSKSNTWTPLSNLRTTLTRKTDNYWLVGVAERTQMLKVIMCRSSKYPQVLPRPNITMLAVQLPLTDADSDKTMLEQEYWKNRHFMLSLKNYNCSSNNLDMDEEELEERVDKYEATCRGTLMKLYMLACKSSKEQRAYEIATIMDVDSLQLAIKYATKSRALVLAQNLNLLAQRKAELEFQQKNREEDEEEAKEKSYSYRSETTTATRCRTTTIEQDENYQRQSDEILIDEKTSTSTARPPKPTKTTTTHQNESQSIGDSMDDSLKSCITPTSIPLTGTRINPFAKSALSSAKSKLTPLNDSSKSIINEIEEKVQKHAANKAEKDAWKPTPTRKLLKSKLSNTPSGSINSFFGSSTKE